MGNILFRFFVVLKIAFKIGSYFLEYYGNQIYKAVQYISEDIQLMYLFVKKYTTEQ